MIPKRVVLENFLSFGSPATEIVFTDDEPLWVLAGPNGVGKSAVFDAITYCLFGCHRGGRQDAERLVRHGSNGFHVRFEFEFDGGDYRITRNRGGRTTQKVERLNPGTGDWRPVAGVNTVGEVRAWSERTLGMEFEAFTNSVLLRQGKADEIITATGTRRMEILKQIIGVERFEELSTKVHEATAEQGRELKSLCTRRDGLTPVTEEEVAAAHAAATGAEGTRTEATKRAQAAAARVPVARQWAKLEADRRRLAGQMADAHARASEAPRIRDDHGRLVELSTVVPKLRALVDLRDRIAIAESARWKLSAGRDEQTARHGALVAARDQARQKAEWHRTRADEASREAKRLRERIERDSKFVTLADEVAKLKAQVADYPADLVAQLASAQEAARIAAEALTTAGKQKAESAGLLKAARARQKEFATVGVGVECLRCGQTVTAAHADRERGEIAAEVCRLEAEVLAAEAAERTAADGKATADEHEGRIVQLHHLHETTSRLLTEKERILVELGTTADADSLRRQLASKTDECSSHQSQTVTESRAADEAAKEASLFEADRITVEKRLSGLDRDDRAAEQALASAGGQRDTLVSQLGPAWTARLDTFDLRAVAALEDERDHLSLSGVADQFRCLQDDAARREEWERQLSDAEAEITLIPDDCRVPVPDAERDAQAARQAAEAAGRARDEVSANADRFAARAAEFNKLVAAIAAAESRHTLHKTLDDLLGKDGLQRELVRAAEREIVRSANDTVRNLSDGDLSIELDADGDAGAFALRLRRADDPTPIGVDYLSGSQKFRVAVSVALAIGRFAAGHSRRLESVIIDEGFGSLDRDGLAAMADELNRLKEYLRRIILVSHQEEFADRFPVVIRLTRGKTGTVAEAVRR